MKKYFILVAALLSLGVADGQEVLEEQKEKMTREGKELYRSEMASWYGTDIFSGKLESKKGQAAGYFSYTEDNVSKCIFFSEPQNPKVLVTISFDSSYNIDSAKVDTQAREFSSKEQDLFLIRKQALTLINADTTFKKYDYTSFNLVPIIQGDEKKVYVLTGPTQHGVVIFGNDYLITFSKHNELTGVKKLHKNIIGINYGSEDEVATMHSHSAETGDLITATDICTLMLYERFAKWESHYVISQNQVSIWDCSKDVLTTMSRAAWDKIYQTKNGKN